MKLKKIITLLAISAMTVSLVSCGKKEETPIAETENSVESEKSDDVASDDSDESGAEAFADEAFTEEAVGEAVDSEPMAAEADSSASEADGAVSDDMAMTDSAASADKAKTSDSTAEKSAVDSDETAHAPEEDEAESGVLTAGCWNDNDNWGFFTNLVNNETIEFPSFGIDPRNRFAVTVKGSKSDDGPALPNKKVTLKSEDGSDIWSSVTGKDGVAYLFYKDSDKPASVDIIKADGTTESYKINVADKTSSGKKKDKEDKKGNDNNQNPTQASDSSLEISLSDEKPEFKKGVDVMFIMDATGSMTDEMTFLQKDFSKIAKETKDSNNRYSVNFYRDEGDEYVTKCFDFTKDVKELQKNLNDQSADGGGDIPEAVHTILDESINKSSWREDAVKLAFLIYDAPPHYNDDVIESLNASVKKASEMGIHLIPVVSSNAERETELFGRAIAICTNSDYVFLTDDSGVGGSHLEPIIGDYKVESLYDTIIKIYNKYAQ